MYLRYQKEYERLLAIFAIFFIILLSSCRNSNTDFDKINLSSISDISQIDLSNFVDGISYIPLETNETNLLGYISKIIISDQFLYVRDNRNLHLFSRDGKYISQVGVRGKGPGELLFIHYFFNGDLHCREIHSDTIFTFKNNEFIPKYIFNQGHRRLTPEVRGNGRYFNENGADYIRISHIYETSSLIFISYWWETQGYYLIKDKKDGEEFVFDPRNGLKNDIDGGLNFIPQFSITQNNSEYIVMWADAFKIKNHTDDNEFIDLITQFPEKKIQLEQLAAEISENDNPVLILGRLRD